MLQLAGCRFTSHPFESRLPLPSELFHAAFFFPASFGRATGPLVDSVLLRHGPGMDELYLAGLGHIGWQGDKGEASSKVFVSPVAAMPMSLGPSGA